MEAGGSEPPVAPPVMSKSVELPTPVAPLPVPNAVDPAFVLSSTSGAQDGIQDPRFLDAVLGEDSVISLHASESGQEAEVQTGVHPGGASPTDPGNQTGVQVQGEMFQVKLKWALPLYQVLPNL